MNAARGIGAEIQDQGWPHSALLVESYVATIFAQLLRRQRYIPSVRKGGLTPASLNRVIEKIDENLDVGLSLSHLAEVVNLSIPHFCRAFKQSLGCPPYASPRGRHDTRGLSWGLAENAIGAFDDLVLDVTGMANLVGIDGAGLRHQGIEATDTEKPGHQLVGAGSVIGVFQENFANRIPDIVNLAVIDAA